MAPVCVYPLHTMWLSGYSSRSWQHPSGLHHLQSIYQQGALSFMETAKCPMVPGPDCMEDGRRCPNGIAHAARLVSAGQYADMHCHATEQCHWRAKISSACRKWVTPRTSQSAGFSIGMAISALITWQDPTYNCMRQFSTSHNLAIIIIIHYGHQWPEMLTRPKNLKYTKKKKSLCQITVKASINNVLKFQSPTINSCWEKVHYISTILILVR